MSDARRPDGHPGQLENVLLLAREVDGASLQDVGRCTDLGRPGIDFIDFKEINGTRWYPPSTHRVGPVFSLEMYRP